MQLRADLPAAEEEETPRSQGVPIQFPVAEIPEKRPRVKYAYDAPAAGIDYFDV